MITYSKFILYLKLSLVMAALSILAILFIVSPPDRFGEPVKVSKLGLEKREISKKIVLKFNKSITDQLDKSEIKTFFKVINCINIQSQNKL